MLACRTVESGGSRDDATVDDADAWGRLPEERALVGRVRARLFDEEPEPVEIGRFVVGERIGTGGLGVVYAAYDPELDRKVAVKLVAPANKSDEGSADMHARLRREARAMAKLVHPNVVTIFDVGVHADSVFVAMELVEGVTLQHWWDGARGDWRRIRNLFVGAARGLAAAHDKGIVHRDFKPSNVIVTPDPEIARVLDFGLARSAEVVASPAGSGGETGLSVVTRAGSIVGTPAYMAPEQARGGAVDPRSDQWSFCFTMWEALFGTRPFGGDDLPARLALVDAGPPEPPRHGGAPTWLVAALRRGLAADPDDRFATMDALIDALQADTRTRGRNRRVAAFGVVLAVATGGAAWRSMSGPGLDDGAVQVDNLRATWRTPNTIRWDFDATGDGELLLEYELVVGTSEQDVRDRSGSAVVWTKKDNPELGVFRMPYTGSGDEVVFTTTGELQPATEYHAQLIARDTAGHRSASNVAVGSTLPSARVEVVVMADEQPGPHAADGYTLTTERPYAGTHAYAYESNCSADDCWRNLNWHGLDLDLGAMSEGEYRTTAHLEFALALENAGTEYYCSMWLWYGDPDDNSRVAGYHGWTARSDGEYHVVQVPLRAFEIDGAPVPYADLAGGLHGVNVGCDWAKGATVRVDEWRIRW